MPQVSGLRLAICLWMNICIGLIITLRINWFRVRLSLVLNHRLEHHHTIVHRFESVTLDTCKLQTDNRIKRVTLEQTKNKEQNKNLTDSCCSNTSMPSNSPKSSLVAVVKEKRENTKKLNNRKRGRINMNNCQKEIQYLGVHGRTDNSI